MTTPQPSSLKWIRRGLQILLPCLLFTAVLLACDSPLIYVLPMLLFFVLVHAWEIRRPLLPLQTNTENRWPANGLMWALNIVIDSKISLVCIFLAVTYQIPYGSGWITRTIDSPILVAVLSILILDFWHYLLHRLMHRWTWLWRMHAVHHSDRDYDLSTGLRFHPLEGIVTTVWMLLPILALGIPVSALMAYTVVVIWANYFTHANVQFSERTDQWMRRVLITPTLHRVHHSLLVPEDHYNYGTIFSFWDAAFSTLRLRSAQAVLAPLTGVAEIPAERSAGILHALLMPFSRLLNPASAAPSAPYVKK